MKAWLIVSLIVGLLMITGIVTANLLTETENLAEEQISYESCSAYGNACTVENNCGLSTCGVVTEGSCGCGR